jgi:hypothetical protein
MHPALHSWRDELPSNFVRLLAYLCAVALLSIAAARLFESPKAIGAITPMHESKWIEIERPFPAFALSIPEATEVAATYAIRRHADGGGRKDILELGDTDGTAPYLHVEIYRPGTEVQAFADAQAEIFESAAALGPVELRRAEQDLASKFGPLTVLFFTASKGTPRQCLAGWFCQGGSEFIQQSTLACALDRLTLLAAGSEPKVGALFAQAERNRSFCGQRDPILAATPKYHLLWKALANRPRPRRIGR